MSDLKDVIKAGWQPVVEIEAEDGNVVLRMSSAQNVEWSVVLNFLCGLCIPKFSVSS